jgi:hypothetical protein
MKRLANVLITFVVGSVVLITLAVLSDFWRQYFRETIVERLSDPIYLASIDRLGLVEQGGKTIMPEGLSSIPALPDSIARDLYRYRVERKADGSCIGLIQVHHWCGTDPVGTHLARIDISSLFAAVDQGLVRCTKYGIDPGSYSLVKLPVEDIRTINE